MKILCENMLLISRNNWLNILQVSDLISSKKLELLTTVFLKNNFGYLLENSEEIEDEIKNKNENENENKSENKNENKNENENIIEIENKNENKNLESNSNLKFSSFLEIVQENYPEFLENILLERKNDYPSPPSNLIIKYIKVNTREKKLHEEVSSRNIPVWAILMAGFSYLQIGRAHV